MAATETLKQIFDQVLEISVDTDPENPGDYSCRTYSLEAAVEYIYMVMRLCMEDEDPIATANAVKNSIESSVESIRRDCKEYEYIADKLEAIKDQPLDEIISGASNFYVGVSADVLGVWYIFAAEGYPDLRDSNQSFETQNGNILKEEMFFAMEDYHRYLNGCGDADQDYCPKLNWDELMAVAQKIKRMLKLCINTIGFVAAMSRITYGLESATDLGEAQENFKNKLKHRGYHPAPSVDKLLDDILERAGFTSDLGKPATRDRKLVSYARHRLETIQHQFWICIDLHGYVSPRLKNCFDEHVSSTIEDFNNEVHKNPGDYNIPIFMKIDLFFRRSMQCSGAKRTTEFLLFAKYYIDGPAKFVVYYQAMQIFDGDESLPKFIHTQVLAFLNTDEYLDDLETVKTMNETIASDKYAIGCKRNLMN